MTAQLADAKTQVERGVAQLEARARGCRPSWTR